MKIVELADSEGTLRDVLELARSETVILRQPDNVDLVLAPVDGFDLEVELLRRNPEFMAYLDELSEQDATIPLDEVERQLGLKPED